MPYVRGTSTTLDRPRPLGGHRSATDWFADGRWTCRRAGSGAGPSRYQANQLSLPLYCKTQPLAEILI